MRRPRALGSGRARRPRDRAMNEREQALRSVLDIARAASIRGEGRAVDEALERSPYRQIRADLVVADLFEILHREPDLVEQWLAYSEDKRTTGGWYVERDGGIGRVGEPESREVSDSVPRAVAEYVLREL